MHVLQHDGNVESELLEEKQNSLKNKMDQQEGQLKEIQSELNSLSSNADTHYLATNFSNLKVCVFLLELSDNVCRQNIHIDIVYCLGGSRATTPDTTVAQRGAP